MAEYTTISEFLRRWRKIDLVDLTADAMEDVEPQLVELNRKQMNEEGITAKGELITPDYARSTVRVKQAENREWRFVTLRDTGSFQNKMYLSIIGQNFDFDSSDSKTQEITAKYSDDVFGLTDENKRKAWGEYIKPLVVEAIRKMTGAI